jgi:hypothetical protein
MIMEAGKFRICKVGWQTKTQGEADVRVKSENVCCRIPSCSGEVIPLFYIVQTFN